MRKFSLLMVLCLLALMIVPSAGATQTDSTAQNVVQGDETANVVVWPEVGLTLQVPDDWQVSFTAQDFNFAIGSPVLDESTGERAVVTMRSSRVSPQTDPVEFMTELAGDLPFEVIEFNGTTAYQIEVEQDGGRTLAIGYFEANQFAFLAFSTSSDQWDEVSSTFNEMIETATVDKMELDNEALNAQMLENYENEGIIAVGNPEATVTMVEFLDFSCPHCADYSTAISRLVYDYVADDDLFIEFKMLDIIGGEVSHVPIAAQVCGVEAGIGWDMHEIIFDAYFEGGREFYNTEYIVGEVEEAELDANLEELTACINDFDIVLYLQPNMQLANEVEASSTPSLLFNVPADEDTSLSFIQSAQGEALRGGLPLFFVYNYIDDLLASQADEDA